MINWDDPLYWLLPLLVGYIFSLLLALRLAYSSAQNLHLRCHAIRQALSQTFDAAVYLHHLLALVMNLATVWLLVMGLSGVCLDLLQQPLLILLTLPGQIVVVMLMLLLQLAVFLLNK